MKPQAAPASKSPLRGAKVLLTRPAGQAGGIAGLIEAAGGRAVHLPLLRIDAVSAPADVQRVKTQLLGLDQYEIAIFVSSNAAHMGLEWIEKYWPQLPMGLSAYAIGPSTADVLRAQTWDVHMPASGVTSEDLLVLPGLQDLHGKRVALFRGKGGRELIAQTLRERGAVVDYIEIYERHAPAYERAQILARILDMNINYAVLTSRHILSNFSDILGLDVKDGAVPTKPDAAVLNLLARLNIIVPSARVVEFAREMGFARVIDAGGAGDEQVLASLIAATQQTEDM